MRRPAPCKHSGGAAEAAGHPYPQTAWPPAALPDAGHGALPQVQTTDPPQAVATIFPVTSLKFLSTTPAMTTTNQAFIKVYRHDAAQTGPSQAIAADDRHSAAVLGESVEIVVAAGSYASRSAGRHSEGDSALATSIDVLPPPMQPSVASTFLIEGGLGTGWRRDPPAGTRWGETTRERKPKSRCRRSWRGSSRRSPPSHKQKPLLSAPAPRLHHFAGRPFAVLSHKNLPLS